MREVSQTKPQGHLDRKKLEKRYCPRFRDTIVTRILLLAQHHREGRIRKFFQAIKGPAMSWLPRRDLVFPTIEGFKLIINPSSDDYQQEIFVFGTYEGTTLVLMSKVLTQGDIFVDIGANIGLMTIKAALLVEEKGLVYAFEPEPSMFSRLEENVALNKLSNVRLRSIALGDQQTTQKIYRHAEKNIGTSSLIYNEGASPIAQIEVRRLDDVIERERIGPIRLIKVDVEGFEKNVLKGARKLLTSTRPPILCIEMSKDVTRPNDEEDLKEIHQYVCSSNDYRCFLLQNGWGDRTQRVLRGEWPLLEPMDDIDNLGDHQNLIYVPVGDMEALKAQKVFQGYKPKPRDY